MSDIPTLTNVKMPSFDGVWTANWNFKLAADLLKDFSNNCSLIREKYRLKVNTRNIIETYDHDNNKADLKKLDIEYEQRRYAIGNYSSSLDYLQKQYSEKIDRALNSEKIRKEKIAKFIEKTKKFIKEERKSMGGETDQNTRGLIMLADNLAKSFFSLFDENSENYNLEVNFKNKSFEPLINFVTSNLDIFNDLDKAKILECKKNL